MIILLYLGTSKKFQKRSSYYDFPAKEITNLIEVSISHCVKTDSSWQSVVNSTQELSELERRFVMCLYIVSYVKLESYFQKIKLIKVLF